MIFDPSTWILILIVSGSLATPREKKVLTFFAHIDLTDSFAFLLVGWITDRENGQNVLLPFSPPPEEPFLRHWLEQRMKGRTTWDITSRYPNRTIRKRSIAVLWRWVESVLNDSRWFPTERWFIHDLISLAHQWRILTVTHGLVDCTHEYVYGDGGSARVEESTDR